MTSYITSPKERESYARQVWQAFKAHGKPSHRITLDLMSPSEWHLLLAWMDEAIPLRIVLRAFEDTKGQGTTLRYYRSSVEQAYKHWLEAVS